MAYWSIEDRKPPTYHTRPNCPSGKRIKLESFGIGSPPGERTQCAICLRLEMREAKAASEAELRRALVL